MSANNEITEPMSTAQLYNLLTTVIKNQTLEIKEEIGVIKVGITTKIQRLEQEVTALESRCVYLERRTRKNNIVVFGLDVNKDNLLEETLEILNRHLGINLSTSDINNIYTVGAADKPPVIVEFISFIKKVFVFKNVSKLKGTGLSIGHDMSKEDREQHKILRRHQKLASEQKLKAIIRGGKLLIGNDTYTVQELEKLERLEGSETEGEEGDKEISTPEFNSDLTGSRSVENHTATTSNDKKRKRRKIQYSPKSRVTRQNSANNPPTSS